MNGVYARCPDLFRYARSELRPARLAFGAVAAALVGVWALAAAGGQEPAKQVFEWILGAQALVALGYGTARVGGSITAERQEGTWDLQRLTPLSPLSLAAGKLLGAPVYAFYLCLALLPWGLLGLLFGPLPPGLVVSGYLALGAASFLALSVGLAISAHASETVTGAHPSSTGILAGLIAVQAFIPLVAMLGRSKAVSFYGVRFDALTFWSVAAVALGSWAFASAAWRIGKDFLEGPRAWRLPAFLAFAVAFGLGWGAPPQSSLLAPALIVYMAAVLHRETAEAWRRWLRADGSAFVHGAPLWLNGTAAFAAAAAGVTVLAAALPSGTDREWRLYPALQACFLARDLAFLQWCRLRFARRPEVAALAFLAFAYLVPAVGAGVVEGWNWRFLFVPVSNPDHGAALNLLPGLAQAAGMGWVLARRLRASFGRL